MCMTPLATDGQVGKVHMLNKGTLVKSLEANSPDVPMVGEVAFFVGAEQPYKVVVDEGGYAKMLVLSRDSYMQLTHLYPEQHELVLSNILSVYGVDRVGALNGKQRVPPVPLAKSRNVL